MHLLLFKNEFFIPPLSLSVVLSYFLSLTFLFPLYLLPVLSFRLPHAFFLSCSHFLSSTFSPFALSFFFSLQSLFSCHPILLLPFTLFILALSFPLHAFFLFLFRSRSLLFSLSLSSFFIPFEIQLFLACSTIFLFSAFTVFCIWLSAILYCSE